MHAISALRSVDLHSWLGKTLDSPEFTTFLSSISGLKGGDVALTPEVKAYGDAVYLNFHPVGMSCLFSPVTGYKPSKNATSVDELQGMDLKLESIDIYNVEPAPTSEGTDDAKTKPTRNLANAAYSPFPSYPLSFHPTASNPPRPPFQINPSTTGKDFVSALGEPGRKGGGAGPSSGSIGIWCEWAEEGLMVEFGGDEASGPQAWERGKDARWKVLTFFEKGAAR